MTKEEAIKGLKNVSTMFTGYKPNEEMFAMAIKALETVSCIKEKCAYCPHCENCDVDDETLEIKALEQQPCEDWHKTVLKLIEAWEKVREEIKYHADNIKYTDAYRDGFEVSLKIIDKHLKEVENDSGETT